MWRQSFWRQSFAVMALLALAVLLIPQRALAEKPTISCPPAFDLGALTFEEALALPGTQRGLDRPHLHCCRSRSDFRVRGR
jgi:hypothetical protein